MAVAGGLRVRRGALDFSAINAAALPALPALCARWMPGGKRIGREYVTFGTPSIVARQQSPKENRLVKTTNQSNDVGRTPGSTAATRMRLHRHRRRQHIRCVTVQLHELEVKALVSKGWLKAETRNDPAALVEALHGHLGYSLLGEGDAQRPEFSVALKTRGD